MGIWNSQFLRPATVSRAAILLAAIAGIGLPAIADGPSTRPLLNQLNDESQNLYNEVRVSIVRVQLPPPRWMSDLALADNPLDKWGAQLDPAVRAKLDQDRRDLLQKGRYAVVHTVVTPTTKPTGSTTGPTAGAPWKMTFVQGDTLVMESAGSGGTAVQINAGGGAGSGPAGTMVMKLLPVDDFVPNNIGLVLDDHGHVLVPMYVEKETIGDDGVRLSLGDEPVTIAKFIASDRQTNTTVLQLAKPAGHPAKIPLRTARNGGRPVEGSLVLLLSPSNASARWLVWTGAQQDTAGIVVTVDGSIAGFARYGQFFSAASAKPVAEQLIQYGKAKRAILGLAIRAVGRNDPLRQQTANLGISPALHVDDVVHGSAAEKAGLRAGDLVLSLGDEPVGDPPAFAAAISATSGMTTLHILRDGKPVDVAVELRPE